MPYNCPVLKELAHVFQFFRPGLTHFATDGSMGPRFSALSTGKSESGSECARALRHHRQIGDDDRGGT